MMANHLFGSCMPTFGSCVDRYCMSGYGGGGETLEECLDLPSGCQPDGISQRSKPEGYIVLTCGSG